MSLFSYRLLIYSLSPIIWLYFIVRAIKAPEYREGFAERLGLVRKNLPAKGIIFHCASVGEAKAAIPLINQFMVEKPELKVIVTTTSPTGKQVILSELVNKLDSGQVFHCYLPIDWPGSCRRFFKRLQPRLMVIMETELWPNLLFAAKTNKCPVMLANARLSEKSLAKYQKRRPLSQQMMACLSFISAQYESDRQNFLSLGVSQDKVKVSGNLKFDITLDEEIKRAQASLKSDLSEFDNIWVAASIHPGEFTAVIEAHKRLLTINPHSLLIAIPRHPEKFSEFIETCSAANQPFVQRSKNQTPSIDKPLWIGDTMGEVLLFCGVAELVFVGGSLVDKGGHNPLEAIACGATVLMGPSYFSFQDIGDALIEKSVLEIVDESSKLASRVGQLFSKKNELASNAEKTGLVMQENGGSVCKQLALLINLI